MKKLSFMPLAALLIALVFSAFTNDTKQIKHDDPLWYYTEATADNHGDASKYDPFVAQDGSCVGSGTVRCVIEAPAVGNPAQPDLTDITSIRSYKP